MTERDRLFLEYVHRLRENDRPGYLGLLCMLARDTPVEDRSSALWQELVSATRGDFKRAIKAIRSVQAKHSDPEWLEDVIMYIRREWLHRGEAEV